MRSTGGALSPPDDGHKRRRRLRFRAMIRAEPVPFEPPRAPAWARPSGSFRENSEAEALFFAGAALSALDSVAKSDPPWAGVWRRRLALKSAAAVAQNLLNRREDEAALRDAVALARPGQDLGPAGRVYAAFRDPRGSWRPFPPQAPRRGRRRPAGAARPCKGGGARRRAPGDGRARPAGPDRRGRGRRSGHRASSPTPSRSRFFAPTPRWPGPSAGQRRCRCSPASFSPAAPRARDGGRGRARPAG